MQSAGDHCFGGRADALLQHGEISKKARPALSDRISEKAGRLIIRLGLF